MHNRFLDKRRRHPNFRIADIKNVLPEHFVSYYPKFIKLLEYYYDFEDGNDSTELLHHLFAVRDINETDITLLSYIEDELLLGESYFKGFGNNETELRAAANFSSILFRSKGTKFAIEWFFRSFYNEDVEVVYPKENIFKIGDSASAIGPDSVRYLTDDKLYQTFALLIKTGVPISKWREVFKLFSHPAGMYLGGEVAITDILNIEVLLQDYVSLLSPSPEYTIGGTLATLEGTDIVLAVNGSNVDNGFNTGTDAVYWYGKHLVKGKTTDSDFGNNYFDLRTGLPDSTEPQYIPITSSTGSFTIKTVFDLATNPPEGEEWFAVRLQDKEGRYLDSANIAITDQVENYTITFPLSAQLEEGTLYNLDVTGINVPNDGNTTLKWYFDPISSDQTLRDSDFYTWYQNPEPYSKWSYGDPLLDLVGLPDSAGVGVEFNITGGVGSITLDPRVDGIVESNENVVINIANANNVDVGSGSFTIVNKTPTLQATVSDVVEGNNLIINVITNNYNIGKQLTYEITGDAATENPRRLQSITGSFEVTSTNMQVAIPVSFTNEYNYAGNGQTSGTLTLTDPNITAAQITSTDTFNINDAPPVYVLSASISPGVEGQTVTYQVGGSNIPNGSVYFYINGTNPPNDADPNNDWTAVMPQAGSRETITLTNGSGTSAAYTYTSADAVEGPQYYTAFLYDTPTGGIKLAELARSIVESAANIVVRDINANTIVTSIEEFGPTKSYRIEISGSPLADGQYYFYLSSNSGYYESSNPPVTEFGNNFYLWDDINEADEATAYASLNQKNPTQSDYGGVKIVSGAGGLEFFPSADFTYEGTESYTFYLAELVGGELTVQGTTTFDITDNSVPGYDFVVPTSVTEDINFSIQVTPTTIFNTLNTDGADRLYFEIIGAASAGYASVSQFYDFYDTDASSAISIIFTTNGDNNILDGPRSGTLYVTRGDYQSGSPDSVVFQQVFTLNDAGISAVSFTASPDVFDEGNSTTFTWTGSNIPDQTKYWIRPTNIYAGTGTIQANNTTMLSVSPSPTTTFAALGYVYDDELILYMEYENNTVHEFNGRRVISWDANSITFDGTLSTPSTEAKSFYIAPKATWDYFLFTTVLNSEPIETAAGGITYDTGNGNGQLAVLSTTNTSLNDGVFEYGLYVNFNDTSPIATEQITITNTNTGATVDLSQIAGTTLPLDLNGGTAGVDPYAVNSYGSNPGNSASATAAMRFYPDGSYRTLSYNEGSLFNDFDLPVGGTWATGNTGDGSGYWINVTTSGTTDINYSINGSTGVWLELNVVDGRAFGVTATASRNSEDDPPQQDIKFAELTIRVVQANSAAEAAVVYAAPNTNKDTKVSLVRARAATVELL